MVIINKGVPLGNVPHIRRYIIWLALAGLCFLAYANSINNNFVSDDLPGIFENPQIAQLSRFWFEPNSLLNSLSYRIAKFNVIPYHLFSIILHSLNTILVFYFLRLFFKAEASFLAACLFAVHPIHVEAVGWVSGRPYIITSLFTLITYFLYHHEAIAVSNGRRINILRYLFSVLIFSYYIIANISFYFIFPFFLILSDITFGRWRKAWKLWLPFLGIVLLRIFLMRGVILQRISFVANVTEHRTIWANPVISFIFSLFSHFGLLIWPSKLTLYHEPIGFLPLTLGLGTIALFFIICLSPFLFKKAKEIFLGIGIFALFLAPTYSPVIVGNLVAERYLYFPSVALSIFTAFIFEKYLKRLNKIKRIGALSLFIIIITASLIRTIVRNKDWKDAERFWQATLAVSPDSPTAHIEAALMYRQEGDIQKAIDCLKKAIEINPDHAKAYNNLGVIYREAGKTEEAVALYKKAIAVNPGFADAYYNLGNSRYNLGKTEEAVALYKKTIALNPYSENAYNNLGMLYTATGRNTEAVSMLRKAIEINPFFEEAYNNLGIAYEAMGKNTEAMPLFRKAIEINADYPAAHMNLAKAYYYDKQYGLAVKYYDRAIELGCVIDPKFSKLLEPFRHKEFAK